VGINTIKIKKVVRPLDLADYEPEYAGTVIQVWVNPPLKITREVGALLAEWQKAVVKRALLEKPAENAEKPAKKRAESVSELEERPMVDPAQLSPSSLEGGTSLVRVDPAQLDAADKAVAAAKRAYYDWLAGVWEDTSADEMWALVEKLEAQEPGMLTFLRDRTLQMIADYASARKKA